MEIYEDKLRKVHGYEEGKQDAVDKATMSVALSYKKHFLKKFISLSPQQIDSRLGGDKYFVTRKYDGEYAIIVYEKGQAITINRSGRVRRGLPCIKEAAELLNKAGVKQAIIPAEIYVHDGKYKSRVNELISTLANEKKTGNLKLAVFDIVELDGSELGKTSYGQIHKLLEQWFAGGERCHVVEMEVTRSRDEIKRVFHQWVEVEGAEGLVVRSELPFVFKIKPRHNLDVVVVGFTEGTGDQKGQVRTMLLAFIPGPGRYQVVGKVGGGLRTKLKAELFEDFSRKIIPSDYIETDSNHVAFQMVRPETVLEISVNDVVYETSAGPKSNAVLEIVDGKYQLQSTVDGLTFVAPVFERMRPDKKADEHDVRITQVDTFSYFDPAEAEVRPANINLMPSEIIFRDVYRKTLGDKLMVQKYLIWKTNKEESDEYPGYVFHLTNFSTGRKEPLQREVNITDSYAQVLELCRLSMQENIKKGWERVGNPETAGGDIAEMITENLGV